jgi:hypothetical protein
VAILVTIITGIILFITHTITITHIIIITITTLGVIITITPFIMDHTTLMAIRIMGIMVAITLHIITIIHIITIEDMIVMGKELPTIRTTENIRVQIHQPLVKDVVALQIQAIEMPTPQREDQP